MTHPARTHAFAAALCLTLSLVACKQKQNHHSPATSSPSEARASSTSRPGEPKRSAPPALALLTESQAQAVLPKEMAAVTLGLPAMYKKVNTLAAAQGLEGWPEAVWPFADDSDPARRIDPLKALHPATRLIWGNVNVLWVHVPEKQRWDAIVLMRIAGSSDESPWRLMLLKDAFGHPSLMKALPKDTWGGGNTLDWSSQTSLTYAKNLDDIQKQWAYCVHPKTLAFTCCPPESDAGLSLQYDPDQGVGLQIAGVEEDDPSEDMNWYLSPKQFNDAKILSLGKDFVWADIDGTKGVAARADWNQWTEKFKNTPKP